MIKTIAVLSLLSLAAAAPSIAAQAGATASTTIDQNFHVDTTAMIEQERAILLDQARKAPSGSATTTLEAHPTSTTMLAVRVASGGAELHQHLNDYFVVLDGEATELVGGTVEGGKVTAPGEIRGTKVVGGVEHPMHKGDVVYIPAGTPHQAIVPSGGVFTYFVIKVKSE
jgi:mannose-6-phosphate isomerase-like protein (cupin superfamily)